LEISIFRSRYFTIVTFKVNIYIPICWICWYYESMIYSYMLDLLILWKYDIFLYVGPVDIMKVCWYIPKCWIRSTEKCQGDGLVLDLFLRVQVQVLYLQVYIFSRSFFTFPPSYSGRNHHNLKHRRKCENNKGTVCVFLSDSQYKEGNVRITTLPFQPLTGYQGRRMLQIFLENPEYL